MTKNRRSVSFGLLTHGATDGLWAAVRSIGGPILLRPVSPISIPFPISFFSPFFSSWRSKLSTSFCEPACFPTQCKVKELVTRFRMWWDQIATDGHQLLPLHFEWMVHRWRLHPTAVGYAIRAPKNLRPLASILEQKNERECNIFSR